MNLNSEQFNRAAGQLTHSLDTFNPWQFVEAVTQFQIAVDRFITAMGMQAANDQRKAVGASMAYTDGDFWSI